MPKQDIPLSALFAGVNNIGAPFSLSPEESPFTYDADQYGGIRGPLGPRGGRARRYNQSNKIMGVIPCKLPFGTFRVIADTANWTGVLMNDAPPFGGFSGLASTFYLISYVLFNTQGMSGVNGTQYSRGQQVGVIDLSKFSAWGFTYTVPLVVSSNSINIISAVKSGGLVLPITCKLQGLITGVWTDIATVVQNSSGGSASLASMPASGLLTAFRTLFTASDTVTACYANFALGLFKGTLNSTTNVNL